MLSVLIALAGAVESCRPCLVSHHADCISITEEAGASKVCSVTAASNDLTESAPRVGIHMSSTVDSRTVIASASMHIHAVRHCSIHGLLQNTPNGTDFSFLSYMQCDQASVRVSYMTRGWLSGSS